MSDRGLRRLSDTDSEISLMTRTLCFLMLLTLALPTLGEQGWTVISKGNPGPQVRVCDASAKWNNEDSVSFVLGVGSGPQEGHVLYELTRAKRIQTVEYGHWSQGRWMSGDAIGEWNDLQPHMMKVWDHFFSGSPENPFDS